MTDAWMPLSANGQNCVMVINSSFEARQLSGDTYTTPVGSLDPTNGVPGWQFGSSGTNASTGIATETGTNDDVLGSPKFIPQGWQAAFIQGTGQFSQSVMFSNGGEYVIRFQAAGPVKNGKGGEPIAVSVDGSQLGIFAPVTNKLALPIEIPETTFPACGGDDKLVGEWRPFTTSPFSATAGAHLIAFAGTVPFTVSNQTTFIDTVQILTTNEAAANAPPTSPIYDFVFVGDSITEGQLVPDPPSQSPGISCIQSLGQSSNIAARMVNMGASGATTGNWLPSTSGYFRLATNGAVWLKTNQPGQLIFSIMLGANDANQHISSSSYQQNLQALISGLLTNFPTSYIFLNYPIYFTSNAYWSGALLLEESYFPAIDQLVASNAVVHPGRVFAGDKLAFGFLETNYLADMAPQSGSEGTFYLHPNMVGSAFLGKFWADAVGPNLGGLAPTFSTNMPAGFVSAGLFQLNLAGTANASFRLWSTSNLTTKPMTNTWTLVTNGTFGETGEASITDVQATAAVKYYAITQP